MTEFEEKSVSLSRFLDFCVFDKSLNFKICDVTIDITAHYKLYFRLLPKLIF